MISPPEDAFNFYYPWERSQSVFERFKVLDEVGNTVRTKLGAGPCGLLEVPTNLKKKKRNHHPDKTPKCRTFLNRPLGELLRVVRGPVDTLPSGFTSGAFKFAGRPAQSEGFLCADQVMLIIVPTRRTTLWIGAMLGTKRPMNLAETRFKPQLSTTWSCRKCCSHPSCCTTNHTLLPCHLLALTWTTPLKSSISFRNDSVSSPRAHLECHIPRQPVQRPSYLRTISKRARATSKTNLHHSTSVHTLLPQTMRTRRQASSTRFGID